MGKGKRGRKRYSEFLLAIFPFPISSSLTPSSRKLPNFFQFNEKTPAPANPGEGFALGGFFT
jgi:hypothetical protein